jgi:hypothetical protein
VGSIPIRIANIRSIVMAEGLMPTENDLTIARNGIMLQLQTVTALKEFDTLEEGVDALGMRDFIENQIMVLACERIALRQAQNILHKRDGFNV